MSIIIKSKDSNSIHAEIDDINYYNINPSVIEKSAPMGIKNNIWIDSTYTHKTAINVVDIDWNNAYINSYINTTSDLLNIVQSINNSINDLVLYDYYIPQNFGTKQYSIGLMSDVHYDDICATDRQLEHYKSDSGNNFNPYEDLEYVLNFYKDNNVDMICCAGDISTNNIEHVHAFNERVKDIVPNIPVYTCKGNHDNYATYNNNQLWLQYTIPENANVTFFTTGDQTSFYYIYNNDVYIYFNLDYDNGWVTSAGKLLDDNISYQFYNPDTIVELHSILNNYRNNRCFIFTHQPFCNKAGNAYHDYAQNRSHAYWLSGYQFALLNELNNHYKNSMWFSGHSHYQWKWQKIHQIANICNFDILNEEYNYNNYNDWARNNYSVYSLKWCKDKLESGWSIHIPSTCRPLRPQNYTGITYYNDAIADPGCEGAIMDMYENGVHLQGYVFADENTQIIYNTGRTITTSDIVIDINKNGYEDGDQTIEQIGDRIKLTFNKKARRFLITNYNSNVLELSDVQVFDINNNDVSSEYVGLSNPLIGVYTTSGVYSLQSCTGNIITSGEYTGIEIPCSSSFNESNLPISIIFKINERTTSIQYENKKSKIANYWIPFGGTNMKDVESKTIEYFENKIQNYNI